ncbi:MAG TPA: hypothetical protein VFU32_09870 [Ktedonobacterales bacterium]|nr:hypothetical protein [Ktedonobacterales bacterium]
MLTLAVLALGALSACSPGHTGGNEIGFLRGGALWAIDPDGSNLHQIESGQFIGFSWSPDHQQIVLRQANGKLPGDATAFGLGDLKSELGVTAIDGGNIIQITPPNSGLLRSDAWWDGSGNRLLYREEPAGAQSAGDTPQWKLSQSDQPAGIARKDLAASAVLPAVNSDGSLIAGIDTQGKVFVGKPGSAPGIIASGALTVLPGSFEPARPLWQPNTGALLYATAGPGPNDTKLLLRQSNGSTRTLATIANLQQYAWSPDGDMLLARTSSDYRLYSDQGSERFAWDDSASASLLFWSPDSRFILILEPDGSTLVNVAAQTVSHLSNATLNMPAAPTAGQAPWLRPATNSPWKADSSTFLFTAPSGSDWSAQPGHLLPSANGPGDGLYVSILDQQHKTPQFPTLLDWGIHQNVAWSTLDPNCAFLLA